ncbi:MAG: hypothetical protein JXB60_01520 [Candidatus Cloacimonetes bacterium]|nr:hypothetical protein [Candidatus Cloacimonadota bacterium]
MRNRTLLKKFLLIAFFLLLLLKSTCDIIPMNSHYVERCVEIVNLDLYPELTLIGCIHGPMVEQELYLISGEKCLYKGYKFNQLYIYWTERENLTAEELESITIADSQFFHLLSADIDPGGYYVDNSSPLISEKLFYAIQPSPAEGYMLELIEKAEEFQE